MSGEREPSLPPISGGAHVAEPTFADVNRDVLATLRPPGNLYFGWMCVVGLILTCGILAWSYQIFFGMGAAGKRTPQMWAMYITTFVFWIGIGHAGTLISAVLYLFRARWRTSIYRAAEAMTIFAVLTAGLFPAIHAGRMWFAYFLMPYPNQRFLWPNFKSPLVWDVFAISTYLSISTVFFIIGLVPDVAALRDATTGWRRRIYTLLSLGWEGSDRQWSSRCTAWCPGTSRWRWSPAGTRRCSPPSSWTGPSSRGSRWCSSSCCPCGTSSSCTPTCAIGTSTPWPS
jgi:Ni/Fe-hydrogenase subunit HybB-like protein